MRQNRELWWGCVDFKRVKPGINHGNTSNTFTVFIFDLYAFTKSISNIYIYIFIVTSLKRNCCWQTTTKTEKSQSSFTWRSMETNGGSGIWKVKFLTISFVFLYSVKHNFPPNERISRECVSPIPHFFSGMALNASIMRMVYLLMIKNTALHFM